ncbi:thiol-disulfide oxidoreductase ResA [Effusibacillus lacus]|uniref:Thiol-disulfide oxidoreductase n=1 Tax=Effusibacillus lacus TaxID=1348429 RepID=A0A292YRM6_9BACL|nr:thiol-disulfide oxidoreductase ResA [Effusibacillus lacus]TCS76288.1 peroxiredoxin [Effusibacillus lacus]GAX91836.1 thiol-disulfide oxidoreductase [Effusibacillus lacus]
MAFKNRTGRALTVGALLLAAIGIIAALLNFTKTDNSSVAAGQAAPPFTLSDLNGNKLSLADLKGKVVLLNFWGSWCDPCRQEMPAIQAAYEQYKDKGFVVVGVNIGESKVTAKGFADRYGVTFPVVLDKDREVTLERYKVGPIPSSFFIDKQGNIQYRYEGPMTEGFLTNKIQTLLAQP